MKLQLGITLFLIFNAGWGLFLVVSRSGYWDLTGLFIFVGSILGAVLSFASYRQLRGLT